MSIRVIRQVDVTVTEAELQDYRLEWLNFCRYTVRRPTLEEYIRRRKADETTPPPPAP